MTVKTLWFRWLCLFFCLNDPDKFVAFAKKDTPAARKLIDVVTKLIDKLKETVKKLTPNGKAAKLLQEDIETYEEAKDLRYQGIESIMEKNAKEDKVQDTTSDIADQRYSIKEIPDTIKEDVMENRKTVANMNPIAELKDTLFEKGEKTLSEQVLHFFNECGNNAYNAVVGDVELSKKGIDDDIAHGMGRAKAITYAAVPQVIEEGKIIDYQSNWKNRGYDTIVFAAPIKITGEYLGGEYLEAVIARRFNGQKSQRFYVHEALSIEKEKLAVLDQEAKSIVDPGDKSLNIYTLLHNTLKYKWEDEKNNYKFSMKDEEKDNIFQKDTLSKSEWAMFYSKIGEKKNRYYFPKAADGNYIMSINNKLVYTNGNWGRPRIDRVIEIDVDGVSGIERSTYISYIQEELIEYEKDGREVSKEILDDIKELNQITYGGKVYIKGYSTENTTSGKRQRTTDTVSIHGESGGAVKEQSNRRRDKKIYKSERSGNLKEKFSLKEPVKETKESNEKDSSQAAVNKLNGVRFSTKEPLGTQIDNVLSGADTNTTHVYVGKTFEVLKELGIKDMPMLITSEHVYSIIKTEEQAREEGKYKRKTNYHGLGKNQFLNTIERLQDPAFIIKSNTDDADTRIVLVTNAMDNEGHYIVGAIQPNGYGTIENKKRLANIILSIYGKKNLSHYIQKAYQEDRIIKINPERKSTPKVQFPNGIFNQDYIDNLAHYKTIVNNNISKNIKNDTKKLKSETNADSAANKNIRNELKDTSGNALFSSKEDDFAWMEDILKEEPGIKETASILQEGTEALQKAKKAPDSAAVRKISKSILEDIGSQYDLDTFSDNLEKVFSYMQSEDNVSYDDMVRVMTEVAWHELVVARREKDPVDIAYREKKKSLSRKEKYCKKNPYLLQ